MTLQMYIFFKADQQIPFSVVIVLVLQPVRNLVSQELKAISAGTASAGSAGQVVLKMSFGVLYRILLQKTNALTAVMVAELL